MQLLMESERTTPSSSSDELVETFEDPRGGAPPGGPLVNPLTDSNGDLRFRPELVN
jgi:hypothetical protein